MNREKWVKKTSRKFWLAVVGFVTAVLAAFGVAELTIEQVCAVVSACGVLAAYIVGEGMADAAGAAKDGKDEQSGD